MHYLNPNQFKGLFIFGQTMNSLAIGIFLLLLPLAFAGGLLYFMMSGKGTKPIEKKEKDESGTEESSG